MLILKYPEKFKVQELRDTKRLACSLPVRLKPFGKASGAEAAASKAKQEGPVPEIHPHLATIADLSESGFRIALPVLSSEPGATLPENFPVKLQIESRSHYHLSTLEKLYRPGVPVRMHFALPAPAVKNFANVGGEVCWAKFASDYFLLGMKLQEAETDLLAHIKETVSFQQQFFRTCLSSF
jgi:hypothetical protein